MIKIKSNCKIRENKRLRTTRKYSNLKQVHKLKAKIQVTKNKKTAKVNKNHKNYNKINKMHIFKLSWLDLMNNLALLCNSLVWKYLLKIQRRQKIFVFSVKEDAMDVITNLILESVCKILLQ